MSDEDLPAWYRARAYAHFDRPPRASDAIAIAQDPARVARHPFLPLVLRPKSVSSRQPTASGRQWKTKKRPIGYVAHQDAHIQARYAADLHDRLEKLYEEPFGSAVLAYRSIDKKCNIDFAAEVFDELSYRGNADVLALDVEGFFDNVNPEKLKQRWCALLQTMWLPDDHHAVLRSVTTESAITVPRLRDLLGGDIPRRAGRSRARICDLPTFRTVVAPQLEPRAQVVAGLKGTKPPSGALGIPQGTPISAVLANLYMLEVDRALYGCLTAAGGSYRRYSDDLLIVVPPGDGAEAEKRIEAALKSVDLNLKHKKTRRLALRTAGGLQTSSRLGTSGTIGAPCPVEYLGLSFDGQQVRLRDSTIARFSIRLGRAVNRARIAASKAGDKTIRRRKLYAQLSPLGWGSAYGDWEDSEGPPRHVPRMGFHGYVRRAAHRTGSEAIAKQGRQLENKLYRAIGAAEERL